jgi:uncharacterized membrane protein YGL010W
MSSTYTDTSRLNKFQKLFFGYGIYHNNVVNVLFHIIFVPAIVLSLDKLLDHSFSNTLKFNPFLIVYVVLGTFYMYLDFVSGLVVTVQYLVISMVTRDWDFSCIGQSHIRVLTVILLFSYFIQQFSHKFFEGDRKPSLKEEFFVFLSAPVFVVIEVLNFTLRYRKDDIDEARKFIYEDMEKYKSAKKIN